MLTRQSHDALYICCDRPGAWKVFRRKNREIGSVWFVDEIRDTLHQHLLSRINRRRHRVAWNIVESEQAEYAEHDGKAENSARRNNQHDEEITKQFGALGLWRFFL